MDINILDINHITTSLRPTVVTVGMFDGVHIGHQHLLQMLLQQGEAQGLLPVVVTFDKHPRNVLSSNGHAVGQLSNFQERMSLLEQCGITHVAVVPFSQELASLSACRFVERYLLPRLNMRCLLLGYDNAFGNKQHNDFDQLPQVAARHAFSILKDTPVCVDGVCVSSTQVRKALQQGQVELAARMLGHPYTLKGPVVHGRAVGRTLGFPTANVRFEDTYQLLPCEGVYAVRLPGGIWGMANLGPQPTFGQTQPTLEVHLLDCTQELYGTTLTIEFHRRLRDIQSFHSAEALAQQLQKDRQAVQRLAADTLIS